MYKNPGLYQMYMEESESILSAEYNMFIESVKRESYYLREHLMPKISPVLAKESNRNKIIDFTGKFIDDHSTQLLTSGPVYIFTFSDKETSFLYDLFNITKKELLDMTRNMIRATYEGESQFGIVSSAPHKILITAILIDSINNNYTDIIECGEYLAIFAEYPLVFRKFWKVGAGVKEDVMEYTIEHLPNKFGIKKQKNLLGFLKYVSHSATTFFTNRLKTGMDNQYVDYIQRLRSQLSSAFRNIANQYYVNYEKNATMHSQSDQMDDGKFVDNEGTTTNIAAVSDNIYNKFLVNDVNVAMAGAAANASDINKDNLVGYLNKIYADKKNRLNKFTENVVYLFMTNEKYIGSNIDSKEFIEFGLALYRSLGTSKMEQHKQLKDILDYWMHDVIEIDKDYTREATQIYYRRGIFNYFIMMMKYYD
jgi:hypothetical protein